MKKLIILDRDGVINSDSDHFIKSPKEWVPIPGSLEAIAALYNAGYTVVVATNQSGIARGLFDETILQAIHLKMENAVQTLGGQIDNIFYCPHGPLDNCDCRKPNPGLFLQIQKHYNQPLLEVPALGDSWRDLQAAQSVGAFPILVLTGKGKKTSEAHRADLKNIPIYPDLYSFAQTFLK